MKSLENSYLASGSLPLPLSYKNSHAGILGG